MLFRVFAILAQVSDDAPPAPVERKMSFGDLQKGFQKFNSGESDPSVRNGLLIMVAAVALIVLLIHFRARIKARKTPDSEGRLFRELARVVRIPFTTRLILKWVARTAKVHAAVLLVSEQAFTTCVTRWEDQPTFSPLRRWAKKRLDHLRPALFE